MTEIIETSPTREAKPAYDAGKYAPENDTEDLLAQILKDYDLWIPLSVEEAIHQYEFYHNSPYPHDFLVHIEQCDLDPGNCSWCSHYDAAQKAVVA